MNGYGHTETRRSLDRLRADLGLTAKSEHKHLRRRAAREKHDNRRPLVECPACGKLVRGLRQHVEAVHRGEVK